MHIKDENEMKQYERILKQILKQIQKINIVSAYTTEWIETNTSNIEIKIIKIKTNQYNIKCFYQGKIVKKIPAIDAEKVFFGEIDKCIR